MTKRNILRILGLAILLISGFATSYAETPLQTLQRAAARLNAAKSIKAQYSMTLNGRTVNGQLVTKGKKFAMTVTGAGTWYDGRQITTYNPQSKEATIWIPTQSELAESNPLLYLTTTADYNVTYGAKASKGETNLLLTPKKRNSGIKSISVTLNASTLMPKSMKVLTNGTTYLFSVKSINLNVEVADVAFKFNKSKYPGAIVTDLR